MADQLRNFFLGWPGPHRLLDAPSASPGLKYANRRAAGRAQNDHPLAMAFVMPADWSPGGC